MVLPIDPVSFPPKPILSTQTADTLEAISQIFSHVSTSAVAPLIDSSINRAPIQVPKIMIRLANLNEIDGDQNNDCSDGS